MKVVKGMGAKFEPYAECVEEACGFATDRSKIARDQGKRHVRQTGHHVRVVTEEVSLYVRED